MRVAVVGGGVFGTTTAIRLARAGHAVTLFEKFPHLLGAASSINQFRLHRGYHYPRSSETVQSVIAAEALFRAEYAEAVIDDTSPHVYGIAAEGSFTTADEYLRFCNEHDLDYTVLDSYPHVSMEPLDLLVQVHEAWFDPISLKENITTKIKASGVDVKLSTAPTAALLDTFDHIVVATYAGLNSVDLPDRVPPMDLQFEVCEKPVVRMPTTFPRQGIIIMDGPFMCIDPYGRSNLFVLGNVVHAIHASNVGVTPIVPTSLQGHIDSGIISAPSTTKWAQFIASGTPFIPALGDAEHVGSLFTVRTVLPRVESTDARPTLVTRVTPRCVRIFSGKIANCVEAAETVVSIVQESTPA